MIILTIIMIAVIKTVKVMIIIEIIIIEVKCKVWISNINKSTMSLRNANGKQFFLQKIRLDTGINRPFFLEYFLRLFMALLHWFSLLCYVLSYAFICFYVQNSTIYYHCYYRYFVCIYYYFPFNFYIFFIQILKIL